MINPVSMPPTPPPVPDTNKVNSSTQSSEHFSMDAALSQAGEEGVIYERGKQTASSQNTTSNQSNPNLISRSGVTLDLSDAAKQAPTQATDTVLFDYKKLLENLREMVNLFLGRAKKILGNLWESKPLTEGILEKESGKNTEDGLSENGLPALPDFETASTSEAVKQPVWETDGLEESAAYWEEDAQIREALKNGDRDTVRTLLQKDGARVPARNSTVLTTYDFRGRLSEPSPSDKQRILHGDNGSRKM